MSYGNCEKKHRTVASFTTNVNDPSTSSWDLTPYKTAGIGTPGGTWRLIEVGYNLLYESGKISSDGSGRQEERQGGIFRYLLSQRKTPPGGQAQPYNAERERQLRYGGGPDPGSG